ncbi:MAG: pitrilysin family protein, partial [Bacteroidota bacterium]
MLNRSIPPEFVPINDINLKQADSRVLKNGIKVHSINAGGQPILNLQLIFKAGKWYEKKQGSALLLSKLMLEGSKKFDASEISYFFDKHGIFWEIGSGTDHITIDIYLLSKYVHKISAIIVDLLSNALLPLSEFQTIKKRLAQQLLVNLQKTSFKASTLFKESLFGKEHPYGYALTNEILKNLIHSDVLEYYNNFIKEQPFEVIASGNIDQKLINQITAAFANLPLQKEKNIVGRNHKKNEIDKTPKSFYDHREGNVQTSVRIGFEFQKRNHPDAIKIEVLNRILGGYFGSRLMKNLREEKGYTYGIHSSLVYAKQAGYFCISTDVIKEKRNEAVDEIHKEIEKLRNEAVSEEELALVKNYIIGNFIKGINSPFSLTEHFKTT